MRSAAKVAFAFALALPEAPAASAQQPSAKTPVFSADTEIVNVTVSVRDAKGQLVPNLSAFEFAVYEDGRPQEVRLFARAVEPGQEEALALDLGLLMDTSQSMIEDMRFSQEAATRFLESIPRARELLAIFFDQDIRISRYQSEHQQGLFERILEARGGGLTALYDAITVYISRVADSPGRKVLVVFTDGEDSTSAIGPTEVIGLVRSSAVTIYPVAFSRGLPAGSTRASQARSFLQKLANSSGGQLFTPAGSKDLPEIYAKILEELKAQYVIGFVSDNPKHDGKFRRLRIEVGRAGLKARCRPGYTVPKDS